METELLFFLKGQVDPDKSAYSGYRAIEDKMDNGEYLGIIPTVVGLKYLSPLPLPVPPQLQGGITSTNPPGALTTDDVRPSVSPWTIGASVATIVGGFLSVVIWTRNRRSRNRRHIQLMEDTSWMDTSSRYPVSV